jgi:aspartate/methionine/tyrosine aminotransferase
MPQEARDELRKLAMSVQISLGWAFPDALAQYAVADLESVSIDIEAFQRKRDRVLGALTQWGYDLTKPGGTFYIWGKAPGGDAASFTRRLADHGVYVMPMIDRCSPSRRARDVIVGPVSVEVQRCFAVE